MKGQAIHMEQLIIIIICVVVLLAVVAFFLGIWNPNVIIYRAKLSQACNVLQTNSCRDSVVTANNYCSGVKAKDIGSTTGYCTSPNNDQVTVGEICKKVGIQSATNLNANQACLKACNCIY